LVSIQKYVTEVTIASCRTSCMEIRCNTTTYNNNIQQFLIFLIIHVEEYIYTHVHIHARVCYF